MEIYISSKMQLVINQYTIGIHLENFYLFIIYLFIYLSIYLFLLPFIILLIFSFNSDQF